MVSESRVVYTAYFYITIVLNLEKEQSNQIFYFFFNYYDLDKESRSKIIV